MKLLLLTTQTILKYHC